MDLTFDLPDGFVSLGWHPPNEAKHLLEALTDAGIEIHAEFDDGISGRPPLDFPLGGFGASASVLVAVAVAQLCLAQPVLRRTFGDRLPHEVEQALLDPATEPVASRLGPEDVAETMLVIESSLKQRAEQIRTLEEKLRVASPDQTSALQRALEQELREADREMRLLDELRRTR